MHKISKNKKINKNAYTTNSKNWKNRTVNSPKSVKKVKNNYKPNEEKYKI